MWRRLIRFSFFQFYTRFAFTYDLVSWIVSLGAWAAWRRAGMEFLLREGLVLDLAHGTGGLHIDLLRAGYQAVGFDLSRQMGEITARKLRGERQPVRLARGRARQMPFHDESFASIIATFPSEFIFDPNTIAECRRVLRSDGVLVIVPAASLAGDGLYTRLIRFSYRVTGQAAPSDDRSAILELLKQHWGAPLKVGGFDVQVESHALKRSVVFILVARKSPSQPEAALL